MSQEMQQLLELEMALCFEPQELRDLILQPQGSEFCQ